MNDDLYKKLLEIPKVELHLHLDGSINVELVSELCGNQNIEEVKKRLSIEGAVNNLSEYLTKFDLPLKLMQTSYNITMITRKLIEDLISDNVIYAEIRFAPSLHTNDGLNQEQVIKSVLEGLKNDVIKTNLILCLMRGENNYDSNMETINLASKYLNNGVCAIDLAGDEAKYPNELYEELFNYAKRKSIPFTIHAGEASDANSIKSAIKMGAKRIGHGVNIYQNSELLNEVFSKQICLEICPTSNINTNIFDNIKNHPLYNYYKLGLNVTISTDNRTVSNITLTDEYYKLATNSPLEINDFYKMNMNAIKSAFLDNDSKKELENILK